MPPVSVAKNSIDRKLHKIALTADGSKWGTLQSLAEEISNRELDEFSYQTKEGTKYSSPGTIASYCALARALGILDDSNNCTRDKADIRSLESFNSWLADLTMRYLNSSGASPSDIERASLDLLNRAPRILPTIGDLHATLDTELSVGRLRQCLQITALLKPKVISIRSRRLYLNPDVFKP